MTHIATILTIDPGKATGWAISNLYDAQHPLPQGGPTTYASPLFQRYHLQPLNYGTVTTTEDAPRVLTSAMTAAHHHAAGQPVRIVIEKFIVTRLTLQAQAVWSSEVTGMAKALTAQILPEAYDHIDATQRPADMKNMVHDPKVLQTLGIKRRGDKMTTHEQDALGHAILYASRLSNRITHL